MRHKFFPTLAVILIACHPQAIPAEPQTSKPVTSDIRADLNEVKLHMVFDGETENDADIWQQEFRKKLHNLMGESRPPETFTAKVIESKQLVDHMRLSIELSAPGHHTLPLYLLTPNE